MKSGRKAETKPEKAARLAFYEGVLSTAYLYENGCWFSNVISHKCEGDLHPCHIIDKQGLKPLGTGLKKPEAMIYDVRNGVPGCQAIHGRFDTLMVRIYQDELPRSVFHFICDWEDALDRPGVLEEKLTRKCPKGSRP